MAFTIALAWSGAGTPAQSPLVASFEYLSLGSRLDWCRSTGGVAFDRASSDGVFDVFVGLALAHQRCLTCSDPRFPGHNGNPAWHPAGGYLVFQAQDITLPVPPITDPPPQVLTSPGWGTNNHLWLISRDGAAVWPLRRIEAGQGTLHPHFSRDGTKLVWAEKVESNVAGGRWMVKMADFVWENRVPRLANIADIAPFGIDTFYETHGFSSDDRKILFTSGEPTSRSLDIYTYELSTGVVQNLTSTPGIWDEHAHMSPDGTKIIWASALDITVPRDYIVPFLDYWVMDADGGNRQRLTYFNEATAPEFISTGAVTTDFSFSADGKTLLARLELPRPDLGQRGEAIIRITLN
jgi:Tol biopolymer transport system component